MSNRNTTKRSANPGLWLLGAGLVSVSWATYPCARPGIQPAPQVNRSTTDPTAFSADDPRLKSLVDWNDCSPVQAGVWSMPESPWSIESQLIDQSQLEHLLLSRPAQPVQWLGSNRPEHLAALDLVPLQLAKLQSHQGLQFRLLDRDTVRTSLCYRELDSQVYVLGIVMAQRLDDERWQVIRLMPCSKTDIAIQHLLPLPGNCQTCCQRVSATGQLQCEILESDQLLDGLVSYWSGCGWLIQEEPFAVGSVNRTWTCKNGLSEIRLQATPNVHGTNLVLTAVNQL